MGDPAIESVCDCEDGDPSPASALGTACDSDEDCSEGATCLRERGDTLFGGGPPGGMCVADCSAAPEECERFGDAVCVSASEDPSVPRAFCFPACVPGLAQLDKCGARPHLACEPLSPGAGEGFCRPFCTRDDECIEGACDRRLGVCSTGAPGGGDLGQPCSPEADPPDCPGICVDLGDGYAVCSRRCTYGSTDPCTELDEARGFCLYAAPGGSLGDVGFCAPVCDCNDECAHPRGRCDPFTSDAVRELLSASGVCAPLDETSEGLACMD